MPQPSFDVNTPDGFNALYFYTSAFIGAFVADIFDADPMGPIDFDVSKKSVEFSFYDRFTTAEFQFVLTGNFNAKLETGEIRQIDIIHGGKNIAEVKNPGIDLATLVADPLPNTALINHLFAYDEKLVINGGRGDDYLIVNAGEVHGSRGNDFLFAYGRASMDGGSGSDTVSYGFAEFGVDVTVGVTVSLADSKMNTSIAKGDTYNSIENVIGSQLDDTLYGSKIANRLDGSGGNDVLDGGAKGDILAGGDGFDYASYQSSKAGVAVNLADPTVNSGDAKGDTFISIEGLIGSSQDDTLTGDASANMIYGGAGDDVIDSGGGNDGLWGDNKEFGVDGDDTFVFDGPGTSGDVKNIMDFDVFDHIQIDRTGFGLHPLWVLNVGTTLIISHANPTATTNSPTFLVEQSTGDLYFDADGNGAGERQLIAKVQFDSQEYLDVNDFVIV